MVIVDARGGADIAIRVMTATMPRVMAITAASFETATASIVTGTVAMQELELRRRGQSADLRLGAARRPGQFSRARR
jgi:hypothetical protein